MRQSVTPHPVAGGARTAIASAQVASDETGCAHPAGVGSSWRDGLAGNSDRVRSVVCGLVGY